MEADFSASLSDSRAIARVDEDLEMGKSPGWPFEKYMLRGCGVAHYLSARCRALPITSNKSVAAVLISSTQAIGNGLRSSRSIKLRK